MLPSDTTALDTLWTSSSGRCELRVNAMARRILLVANGAIVLQVQASEGENFKAAVSRAVALLCGTDSKADVKLAAQKLVGVR